MPRAIVVIFDKEDVPLLVDLLKEVRGLKEGQYVAARFRELLHPNMLSLADHFVRTGMGNIDIDFKDGLPLSGKSKESVRFS